MNSTSTTFTSYMTDIVFHFYEDTLRIENLGAQFGLHINEDYFRAISFLYPYETYVSYDMKLKMKELLAPITGINPFNSTLPADQFLIADKGVVLFLVNHDKDTLLSVTDSVCDKALAILNENITDTKIRIGIGTIESGTNGISLSYENAVNAVKVGEKFKKERQILDYISMEIYSAINAMVLAYGDALIKSILKQLTSQEQTILGKYYKCKELIPDTAAALNISESEVIHCLEQIKIRTGLDVNDTEDNFKLNFIMIAKRVLEKEKKRR